MRALSGPAAILKGIAPVKFRMFRDNPEEFIVKVSRCILAEKATMVVDHISYHKLDDSYDSEIFTEQMPENMTRAFEAKRCIQDYVFWDSEGERDFAHDLDSAEGKVAVYAKLPRSFQIPTPGATMRPIGQLRLKREACAMYSLLQKPRAAWTALRFAISSVAR